MKKLKILQLKLKPPLMGKWQSSPKKWGHIREVREAGFGEVEEKHVLVRKAKKSKGEALTVAQVGWWTEPHSQRGRLM